MKTFQTTSLPGHISETRRGLAPRSARLAHGRSSASPGLTPLLATAVAPLRLPRASSTSWGRRVPLGFAALSPPVRISVRAFPSHTRSHNTAVVMSWPSCLSLPVRATATRALSSCRPHPQPLARSLSHSGPSDSCWMKEHVLSLKGRLFIFSVP